MRCRAPLLLLVLIATSAPADDEPLTVAVSSNFAIAFGEVAARFSNDTGIHVRAVPGSTGKLYAQIINAAPFDIYLAADSERPARLEKSGHAVAGSRFTYARGRLVLWSLYFDDCHEALRAGGRIALANPDTAPYGKAGREYLQAAGYWDDVSERIVYGENVMQAMQFAATGGAAVGVLAQSVLDGPHAPAGKCRWSVPEESHTPVEQQAVLLARAKDDARAVRLMAFLQSDAAHAIVSQHGYGEPR